MTTLQDKARTAAEAAGPAFYVPYLERKGVGKISDLDEPALGRFVRAAQRAARHPGYMMLPTPLPVVDLPLPVVATLTTKALRAEIRTLGKNLATIADYESRLRAEIARRADT